MASTQLAILENKTVAAILYVEWHKKRITRGWKYLKYIGLLKIYRMEH